MIRLKVPNFSTPSSLDGIPSGWTPGQAAIRGIRRAQPIDPGLIWQPQEGPQTDAYNSDADVIGYGGAAGGGKTDLLLGLAGTRHRRAIIFRRIFPNARGIIERSREVFGLDPRHRYNETLHIWRLGLGKVIEIGAMQREDDKKNHMGQARDLIGFDEVTEFTESQVRFVMAWNRSTFPGQKCRTIMTFNPPMDAQGDWVMRFFGPWLDPDHPKPAQDGDVRWFAMIDDHETEVESGEPFEHNGIKIAPRSRTFFHASLKDNPILDATGYGSMIDSLPEPLRSLLKGKFDSARLVDPWQVIPTEWVKLAQKRWQQQDVSKIVLDAIGCDVARGGKAKTVLAKRYGVWIAPLEKFPGAATPDGPSVAAIVMQHWKAGSKVNLDAIGVGTSPFDILQGNGVDVFGFIASEGSRETDKSKKLKFRNLRAEAWWKMREALDPVNGDNIALPPDKELMADLTAPRWSLSISGVLIESKQDIEERLGRSTDCGDAVVMACWINNRGQFEQGEFVR